MWSHREEGPGHCSLSKKLLSVRISTFDIWVESCVYKKKLSYTLGKFPTSWKLTQVFPIPKKVTSLAHSTIVPLQLLSSYLKQWRPLLLNNFLPSLKQIIFFLITSMALEKPGLLAIFLLMLSMSGPLL